MSDSAASPTKAPILLEDLVIRYGDFTAVAGLSFALAPGEVFGLLGPNGAGKTTTFLSLTRQVQPSSGRLEILGFDVATEFQRIKPLCGYVPDVENHIDEFTAAQNLRLFADLYGVSHDRIDPCLEMVELLREKNLPVRAYSKGMRKKLLLARELLHEPRVLLLDEPTANLDVHSTELIRNVIQTLSQAGVTILLTTHNMREVEQVCHRVAIINHGRLVALDSPIAFKARNTERIVDVVWQDADRHTRLSIDLNDDTARHRLAEMLQSVVPVTLHTREFDFSEVFLKITGEKYN